MARWRGWWRILRADQWGVFFIGSVLGMVLPAILYVTFLPRGTDIQGLGISDNPPPGLPWLDVALFFDAGVAWLNSREPKFAGGDRGLVSSYGLALRANMFGAAIIEVDFVHPNDRPGNRWYTQFGFSPGW